MFTDTITAKPMQLMRREIRCWKCHAVIDDVQTVPALCNSCRQHNLLTQLASELTQAAATAHAAYAEKPDGQVAKLKTELLALVKRAEEMAGV